MRTHPIADKHAAVYAAETLKKYGVILYPTDTLYGLGADAFSNDAVDRVYAIKGRDEKKPVHALVADLDMAARFGEIPDIVAVLNEKLPRGKVTFIVKKLAGLDTGIARGLDTFGFRIPDSEFCIAMIEEFGGPITATSANKAGESPLRSVEEILTQIGEKVHMIDLVIDAGELPRSEPSTVIDLSQGDPKMMREGAVTSAAVMAALGL